MEEYITIPGFPKYRINPKNGEVQSCQKNGWKSLRPKPTGNLLINGDIRTRIRADRLLYAALRNINPALIPKGLSVVKTETGGLTLVDHMEFLHSDKITRKKKSAEELRQTYLQSISLCNTILQAYETDDYSQVIAELSKYENDMRDYMRARRIAYTKDTQDELWAQALDFVIQGIRDRRLFVSDASKYLKRVIRSQHAKLMELKKRIRSLDNTGAVFSRRIL